MDESYFFDVIRSGNILLVREYLSNDPELEIYDSYTGYTPLHLAIALNHIHLIPEFLSFVDLDQCHHDMTPLMLAAQLDHDAIFEILLDQGQADITIENSKGKTVKDYAYNYCKRIIDSYYKNSSRFLEACRKNRHEYIEIFLKEYNNIHVTDTNGNNGLMLAIMYRSEDVIAQLLVDSKIDLDHFNNFGESALSILIPQDRQFSNRMTNDPDLYTKFGDNFRKEITRYLLEMGANPIMKNFTGINALDKAFSWNCKYLAEMYIEHLMDHYSPKLVQEWIEHSQETTPQCLLSNLRIFPRTKRAYSDMKRLLDWIPRNSYDDSMEVECIDCDQWINTICLDMQFGKYESWIRIPVIRYGLSWNHGYYHLDPVIDPQFTWYYLEPDSEYYLESNCVYIAKNKLSMYLSLQKELGMGEDYIPIDSIETIAYYLNIPYQHIKPLREILQIISEWGVDIKTLYETIVRKEYLSITKEIDNYFMKENEVLFGDGGMDDLDPLLWEQAKKLGYDILIFTHQSGCSGRLVSECLDCRSRLTSLGNIRHITKNQE